MRERRGGLRLRATSRRGAAVLAVSASSLLALLALVIYVLAAPSLAAAQVLPEDDPSIPDSLRFQSPEERAAEQQPVPGTWSVHGGGDGFNTVFEDLPDDNLGVEEDYSGSFKLWPYLHYNRVDAWALGLEFGFAPEGGWYPEFDFRFVQAFNRDHRWLYIFSFRQPILSDRRLLAGVEARRFTDHFDSWIVPSGENFLSSFFFKYDYRDYFERSGFAYFLEGRPVPPVQARLAYERYRFTSIPDIAPGTWSIFRNSQPWRANPTIDEGRYGTIAFDAALDSRPSDEPDADGVGVSGGFLVSSQEIGSVSDFSYYHLEGRTRWTPRHNMFVKARVGLYTTGTGSLPLQYQISLGGISTLRAHSFKSSRGDHAFLANAEYQLRILRGRERAGVRTDLRAVLFLDAGQAWLGESYDLSKQAIQVDAGLGLTFANDRVALYAAQNLRQSEFDPLWSVRISQPF